MAETGSHCYVAYLLGDVVFAGRPGGINPVAGCKTALKDVGTALETYPTDNDGRSSLP